MRHTLLARDIAGHAPYRYQLDAFSFIASTVAGDTGRAIQLAEACHALMPDFAPPLRYLSALYAYKGRTTFHSRWCRSCSATSRISRSKAAGQGIPRLGPAPDADHCRPAPTAGVTGGRG